MSFFLRQLFVFFAISALLSLTACNSVEKEGEFTVEVVNDETPEVDDLIPEEADIDALDVEISTLVGTWEKKGFLAGSIKPPKSETFGQKLKIYYWRDQYYVDYSFTVKERISLDGKKRSRRNAIKTSDICYKRIPFNKENKFFFFTIPDSKNKIYFIANINDGKIVLEESDNTLFFSQASFKTYYIREDNEKAD